MIFCCLRSLVYLRGCFDIYFNFYMSQYAYGKNFTFFICFAICFHLNKISELKKLSGYSGYTSRYSGQISDLFVRILTVYVRILRTFLNVSQRTARPAGRTIRQSRCSDVQTFGSVDSPPLKNGSFEI